jgi:hypothetical protein
MFSVSRLARRLLHSILLIGTGSVWAQAPPPHAAQPPPPAQKGNRSTLPESVRRVERQTGGEVLRAEPMQRDGREVYRLKVLTADGRVRVVQDDPNDRKDDDDRPRGRKDKEKQSSRDSDETPPQY